jgi:3-deoxy-D-arabino-heptulosonate 7-phosphate (DAHP) synthase
MVDPSHGTGRRDKVDPDTALSDGPQSITPDIFESLIGGLRQMAPILGRKR